MTKVWEQNRELMEVLALSEAERAKRGLPVTIDEMVETYNTHWNIIETCQKQLPEYLREQRLIKQRNKTLDDLEVSKDYDSDDYLQKRTPKADKALLQSIQSGNSASIKLFYQLLGRLTERAEITVGLSADEIARRNLEAERELREEGWLAGEEVRQRVEEVQEKPPLLSE